MAWRLVAILFCLAPVAAKLVPVVTFDGKSGTTWKWTTMNDPVMGGVSKSAFYADSERALGIWDGEVKTVPFLKQPGFCNLQAPPMFETADFPDLSGTDGLIVHARQTQSSGGQTQSSGGLSNFSIMLMTKGAEHLHKQGVYTATFVLTDELQDHYVPFTSFVCAWQGHNVSWCPDVKTQLAQITNVGLGTAIPGPVGKFHVEIASVSASTFGEKLRNSAAGLITLAEFDGDVPPKVRWEAINDTAAGGQSTCNFDIREGYADYSGICRAMPSTESPGYSRALTVSPMSTHFADISNADGIVLGLRSLEANVTRFAFAFCDSHVNLYRCEFGSFKASFEVIPSTTFSEVFLPWTAFSDQWSQSSGRHTAKSPPNRKSLRSVSQLQLWTEGVVGRFHLQLRYVLAGRVPATLVV